MIHTFWPKHAISIKGMSVWHACNGFHMFSWACFYDDNTWPVSQCLNKPTNWCLDQAKTQIRLGIFATNEALVIWWTVETQVWLHELMSQLIRVFPGEIGNFAGFVKCACSFSGTFVCLFDLILYVPSTIFQLYRDGSSWVEPVLS